MTTADISKLEAAARSAAATLAAAKAEEAATAKAAGDERQARSIDWAYRCISRYPQRQGEANERVTALLATFDEVVETRYAEAPSLYLAIARAMATANAVGAEYAKARSLLRSAGHLAPQHPGHREDPIGYINAPYPPNTALPPFGELVASSLERARIAAFRIAGPAEDPGAFADQVSDGERQAVAAFEWTLSQDMEQLLALRTQHPARYQRAVSPPDQLGVEAYAIGRAARGYDAPLPKMVGGIRREEPAPFGPDAVVRVRLYDNENTPTVR